MTTVTLKLQLTADDIDGISWTVKTPELAWVALPKSRCRELARTVEGDLTFITLRIPEWIARDRKLIKDSNRAERLRLYKLLHVGKKQLAWSDDQYRDVLQTCGAELKDGEYSASTMMLSQLKAVRDVMKKAGFTPRRPAAKKPGAVDSIKQARINKAYAIWCALNDAGVVKLRSRAAFNKYAARFSKMPVIDWATTTHLNQIIEGLKGWAKREGVVLKD